MCARAPTSHAIVREALTELIPHDKENREWKVPQLAVLLHNSGRVWDGRFIVRHTNGGLGLQN